MAAFEELTDEKREKLKRNRVISTPLGRIQPKDKKLRKGRALGITARKMAFGINSYFDWCEDNDRVPSMVGMALHLKISRESLYKYMHIPEYAPKLEEARNIMREWVENDIYGTPGQAAGKIAYAKNVHGWAEKIDQNNTNDVTVRQVLTVEDAKARIAALAHLINPELLEAVAGKFVQAQIGHIEAEVINANP